MSPNYLHQWLATHRHEEWTCLRRTGETSPVVSVVIPTYQHVAFIDRCVKSVLAQRTDFPVEIIIGEDGSTDGTRERVQALYREHPDRITAILQPRTNNFAINGRPTSRYNLFTCFAEARGKYIAWCDGDDYFIDEEKLTRQVERLEADEELIGVWTEFVSQGQVTFRRKVNMGEVFGEDGIWPVNNLGASTTMIRREALDYIDKPVMSDAEFFDITFWIRLFKIEGLKGGYLHEPMVNYTLHAGSFFSSMDREKQLRKKLQMRVQAICQGLIDPGDFNLLVERYEREVKLARRTGRWGFRHLMKLHWFRTLLAWWKAR